jgi:hypothetical protein
MTRRLSLVLILELAAVAPLAVAAQAFAAPAGPLPTSTAAPLTGALNVTDPTCGDANGDGSILASDALAALGAAVGPNGSCTTLVCDCLGGADGITATDALAILRVAVGLLAADELRCPTVARVWMEELLDAIRLDTPRPTVHARNLFHLSVAMWDAWVAYDQTTPAVPYLVTENPPAPASVRAARNEAISYAAFRLLVHRFGESPGKVASLASFAEQMADLGYDTGVNTTDGDTPAAVGNRIAAAVIDFGSSDGANEAANYADTTGYLPVNEPLIVKLPGTEMNDPNRWQPLSLDYFVTQNGIPLPIAVQTFIGAHWDLVTPFALVRSGPGLPYDDPGLPPQLGGQGDADYKDSALEVIRYSGRLDPGDGVMIDISPGASGNNPLGTNDGNGWSVNPATGLPYEPNVVPRADWGRVLAEFWADGPDSETPPGHWNTIANYVSDHPLVEKRLEGTGAPLDDLEWDVKVYLALNGAVHDAAVAGWGSKAIYDYSRPISMIRYMCGLGQSTDPMLPSYDPSGIPLVDDSVELIGFDTTMPGERHAHLAGYEDEIAIRAWQGNPEDPETSIGGVGWIRCVEWVPYQRATFVTPAFAAYVSGHSTFSRAGAEVMTRVTGSPYFPGGLGEFRAPAHAFLEFEDGPTQDITLQWATYQDASDEAGLSRLYGGIHVRSDDFNGRIMGYQIGNDAYDLAKSYWDGSAAAGVTR